MRPWIFALLVVLAGTAAARSQPPGYDYFGANRQLIRNGVQAVLTCNGLFTSGRSLAQVYAQELAYLPDRLGDAAGGPYQIDRELQAVRVGGGADGAAISAAFRPGIGCVVLAPDQNWDDIDSLPRQTLPAPAGDPAAILWPLGDRLDPALAPPAYDAKALQAASDWAFERPTPEQVTISLLVVYQGQIIHERYAPGFTMHTRTRTWSTAKSIAATLIGLLVDAEQLALDQPLELDWLPAIAEPAQDPRRAITLRHVLHMSSGLYPVDSFGMEYATGSGLAYWAGASSSQGARNRGLLRTPGTVWDYENYDTLLAVLAMKQALGDSRRYLEFPRRALLDPLGMRNTLLSTDRFGDFVLSSQVYTNARDLARFGLLYARGGLWQGQRLLSKDWISFVSTPAPASAPHGHFYGGQWWLVPEGREDVPAHAIATAGNRGQYVVVIPDRDLVIVRRGLDYGKQGFDRWDLTREILKALPQ